MEQELENVNKESTQETTVEQVDESKFMSAGEDGVIKIDLDKIPEDETTETEADTAGMVGSDENTDTSQEQEEVQSQGEVQETEAPVLEEVVEEKVQQEVEQIEEAVEEAVAEAEATGKPLPENIQKLVEFMDDTGGTLEDYVRLNTDISKLDTSDVLDEYYKQTKPHLSSEERNFLLEEKFGFDEEVDEPKDIKRKKIQLKEEAAQAREYLESRKEQYYEDIKAGSKLTAEQQKAVDFFNRYNKDSETQKKASEASTKAFRQKTDMVFNEEFKGFDFNVGDKKYRYNVKNTDEVKATQSDINNFINKFVDDNQVISDAAGYHKSLFAAMNPDAVAKHFYEQGKADAIKQSVAQAKNINTEARSSHGEVAAGGVKVRVLGDDSNSLRFKIKNKR